MPLGRTIARVNRWLTNPIARRFAGRLPPFAIVEHRGRASGKRYRTPVMAFPSKDGFVFALTYGLETDWVRNVLAEGGCVLDYRGRTIALTEPRLSNAPSASLPRFVSLVLRLGGVHDFLSLRRANGQAP